MTPDNTPLTSESAAAQTARANSLWASLVVEELVRSGVRRFFIAPGSRSTPLVAAIADNVLAKTTVHYDERGTAFAALGYARATGKPAAWVTTSGTAVANGLPAIVEASVDDVPMLLLTADRPPELRRSGANQTIDQPGIFGRYVRWEFDVPAPDPHTDPAFVLTTVDQAVHHARKAPSGPVHLNLMFREPLLPSPEDTVPLQEDLPHPLSRWHASDAPYTTYSPSSPVPDASVFEGLREKLAGESAGLVVAGRMKTRAEGEAVANLADALGWPVLPDIGSQVRLGIPGGNVVVNYDLILSDEEFTENHLPQTVLHFGGGPVSKRLQQFIARSNPERYVVVGEGPDRLDPAHIVTLRLQSDVVKSCKAMVSSLGDFKLSPEKVGWNERWRIASERIDAGVAALLDDGEGLSEPFVAREISRRIPEGHSLVVASSMPVRDMDTYAAPDGNAVPVTLNRGASGIDGTIATAAGVAIGSGSPVTVLVGDLALLHDLNSLAMLRGLPVTVVAINNDGGGIFSMLPVSLHEGFFERYFGTPHGLGFADAARMFGLEYAAPRTKREFTETYRKMSESGGAGIVEVATDRASNTSLRRDIVAGSWSLQP